MRPLTVTELKGIYGGQATIITTVVVTGHYPQPTPVTQVPLPDPKPGLPPSPPVATPMATTPPCTNPANAVNTNAIFSNELGPKGNLATAGYVPGVNIAAVAANPNGTGSVKWGASGMTIGYGVDLGQMTATQLLDFMAGDDYVYPKGSSGILTNAYNALLPYVGVRGSKVATVLAQQGGTPPGAPTLIAQNLSNGAVVYQAGRAANDYYDATYNESGVDDAEFFGLSAAVQTALTDITYVFGSIYSANSALPSGLVNAVGTQNWSQVATLLSNAPNSVYSGRLKSDGQMIQKSITAGTTPGVGHACT